MKNCINHPERKAISVCHNCGKEYCKLCLVEGQEHYYCKDPLCQEALKKEQPPILPSQIVCPKCSTATEPSKEERRTGKFHCPQCELFIDYNFDPPKILEPESYTELFPSMNQGDIALIRSVFDDAQINYYVTGQNFLSVEPLAVPARFFVLSNQVEEAKELLKDFKLHIFGASDRNDMKE